MNPFNLRQRVASALLSVLILSPEAFAGGGEVVGGQPTPIPPVKDIRVPVSDVRVMSTGCGAPPPPGQDCPNRVTVSFVVPYGGSCHTYRANVFFGQNQSYLSIYDTPIPYCTRPEIINYRTTVRLNGAFPENESLRLLNPLYVVSIPAP